MTKKLPSIKDDIGLKVPIYKSMLIINDSLNYCFESDQPNFFWRFMHYIFFGFKWKKIEDHKND